MMETSSSLAVTSAMDAPMSSSLGAMGPLLRKLDSLLPPDYRLPKLLKDRIELLKADLEEISVALLEQSMVDSPNEMAKYWMNEVRDLSYEIEDFIDNMMSTHADAKMRSAQSFKVGRVKIAWLPKAQKLCTRAAKIAELRTLVREASERHDRYLDGCLSSSRSVFSGHARVPVLYAEAANNLVGVDELKMKLIKCLTDKEEEQLKVLAIVGPAGVGKTTLARQVYHELGEQFECRAFVRASRKPDMRRLLGGILSQVQRHQRPFGSCTVQNLIDNLTEHLQDKRYAIVIDDLWETTAWDIVISAFPEGNSHSRIITTAEIEGVALECCDYQSNNILKMKPLGREYSRELLFSLVFGPERLCPEQLNGVLDIIITKCAGLPLATICVAGLLTNQPGNTELWQHVQEFLCSNLSTNSTFEETLQEVLKLSYNSLPHYLKTCLMYLIMYPEGYTMWKVDLVKQWIAEGFIGVTEGTEIGEVADSYFRELLNKGMIQPVDINYNAEVLSCTLHHVVLDLLKHESSEEHFITALDYSQTITGLYSKAHRLSLHFSNTRYATKPTGPKLSKVRSIGFFGILECVPSVVQFKLLRVLILEFWGDHRESTSFDLTRISRLVQLRFLKISCDASVEVELPTQVGMLKYLETLIIDAAVSAVPQDIIHLSGLWHLSLGNMIDLPDEIGRIRSLRTLHYFDVRSNSEDNILSLGNLMNLQDLHLTYYKDSDEQPTEESYEHLKRNLRALASSLVKLVNLKSVTLAPGASGRKIDLDVRSSMSSPPVFLQRLELLPPICIFSRLPEWIGQLQKLCILEVVVSELLMKDMDMLIGLPALTILSIHVRQPTTESIIFKRGAFLSLKYFKYTCGVLPLNFQEEAFPNLQRLELSFNAHRGVQYDHLLSGIEYLLNLKEIVGTIGAAADAEEPDRRAAESAFKDAIRKHPRFPSYDNVKMVDSVCEEYQLKTQEKDSSSEKHEILQKEHRRKEGDSTDDQFRILWKGTDENTKHNSDRISHFPATGSIISFDQIKTGLMENFSPWTLLNSISHLSALTSDGSTARPKPIQKYCQDVCDISSIVSPLIQDICKSPEEQLNEVLRDLGTAINEASGLIANWHQTTSKIYFVWQIETMISDIQQCSLQLCQLANSLLPSLTGCACICIQKLEDINYKHMSDLAKQVAVELTGRGTQSPAKLSIVSSSLSLSTNLELYMEAVSLENLRARAMRSDNHKELDLVEQMIPMVNYMHERLLRETQLLNIKRVPIPADFCCPLSLELMSDPVVLASGQTYERVYIKLWLDEGFTICPKTRQRLVHFNLIRNYTVKALISNWCESHDINLPDPVKSLKLNFPSAASSLQDLSATCNSPLHPSIVGRANIPGSPEADLYMRSLNIASPPHSVVHQNSDAHVNRPGHEASTNQSSEYANCSAPDIARLSLASSEASSEERHAGSNVQTSEQSTEEAFQASHLNNDSHDHLGSSSVNHSPPNSGQLDGEGDIDNGMIRVSGNRTNYISDASGEVADGGPSASLVPQKENVILPRLGMRGQFVQRQPSDRGFPRIISSSSMDARDDLSAIRKQVYKLIDDLISDSIEVQRSATSEIRLLAKYNMENRIVIANCGAINLLVGLLHSPDAKIQENAVTALHNLSINDNNKITITNADAVDPLIHVLETGNPEAKENSAATLIRLSVIEENKVRIGRSGAVKPLVDLLENGTPRGKKDAATALFNLSILHENKHHIVQADAVKHLVDLMDPAAGMVDKAVAVLANLATIPEGRTAIGQARGIPALVEVVELGSGRGKENAAAALLQLCTNSNNFCSIVLQEGAVPHLVALSQSGTPRAREKAQALLSYFRSQRHGSSARR